MKAISSIVIIFLLGVCFGASITKQTPPKPRVETVTISHSDPLTEWQIFSLALAEIESSNNPHAVGNKNDGGIFQITPMYLKEVNRIQNEYQYSLSDRFDIDKSLEMFKIINDKHNPEMDIEKAIKIHNSLAPSSYRNKIINKMAEIEKREVIRFHLTKKISL